MHESFMADLSPELRDVDRKLLEFIKESNQNTDINRAIEYHLSSGGKRIRPMLCLTSAKSISELLSVPLVRKNYDITISVAACCELLHAASLILDDVVDNSKTRRGKPSVNAVWGNKIAVISGSYILATISSVIIGLKKKHILERFSEVSKGMAIGEMLQLSRSFDPSISLNEYLEIISLKTAGLFSLSCEVAGYILDAPKNITEALREFGMKIGLAFQVKDDILDYVSPDTVKFGKPSMKDIKEGKVTLPLIMALKTSRDSLEKDKIISFLENRCAEVEHHNMLEISEFVRRNKGIEKAMEIASKFTSGAKKVVENIFGRSSPSFHTLSKLADFIVQRDI
jgi:octaprenyl-diphosphate synthase